ncbi:response regulator transcription factor [Rhodococcus sp. X156]|uniref:response regulator n=1 Tax=Rhodococcus sp. X156 TaxID=2499145 RepID=UPI000FDCD906|nr:response regulator transcription factor [Rhodococcus sp. X156]
MTTPPRLTVLIADDDRYNRRGISEIFAATDDIVVVGEIEDGDQAVDAVTRLRPHVVLMDLKMRRTGGLDATRELMRLPAPPKVVAMTALDVDDLVVQAMAAGAHSFLSKDEPPEMFQLAVRVAAAGNMVFSPESLQRIIAAGGGGSQLPPTTDLAVLTDRERDVLAALAVGDSNSDIARRLYLGETTVKSHVSAVLAKLGVSNRVGAALVAFRAGLVS